MSIYDKVNIVDEFVQLTICIYFFFQIVRVGTGYRFWGNKKKKKLGASTSEEYVDLIALYLLLHLKIAGDFERTTSNIILQWFLNENYFLKSFTIKGGKVVN